MKRYIISIVIVLAVLAAAWTAFGQDQDRARRGEGSGEARQRFMQRFQNMSEAEREKFRAEMQERFQNMSEAEREKFRAEMRKRFGSGRPGTSRQEQLKTIEAIEEQVARLKSAIESTGPGARSRFRDLSEAERAKLREKMAAAVQERQKAIKAIEEQIAKLRGPGQQRPEPRMAVGELKAIHDLAVEEKATQTARRIERLIARYQRDPGDRQRDAGRGRPGPDTQRRDRPVRPPRRPDVQGAESGKKAPSFTLTSFDGKTVSLSDYRGKIVVLEWLNFECPFVKHHYDNANTMVNLAKKYKGKDVVWLAVNSTNHTTPEANKAFARKRRLPYPILDDRPGKVGREYSAKTTPHMYVIDARGNIVYDGAIDDSPLGKKKEGVINYVDRALADLLAGRAVNTPNTKPYGCTVKYPK